MITIPVNNVAKIAIRTLLGNAVTQNMFVFI